MTTSTTPTPGDDRRRDMSPDEKLIAQWEAQHDVAARGHRGDPLGLQRSLSRERLAERVRPPRGATGSRDLAARGGPAPPAPPAPPPVAPAPPVPPAPPVASDTPHEQSPPTRRQPWWRFRHHSSEH
jgi:hypothetical protein